MGGMTEAKVLAMIAEPLKHGPAYRAAVRAASEAAETSWVSYTLLHEALDAEHRAPDPEATRIVARTLAYRGELAMNQQHNAFSAPL